MFNTESIKNLYGKVDSGIQDYNNQFILGTIDITNEQYDDLLDATNNLLKLSKTFCDRDECLIISLTLVSFAIKEYKGGRFWDEISSKLGCDTNEIMRIGKDAFESFCRINNLYFHMGNKNKGYVTSILAHSIIPNSNLPRFLDFLQDLYFKDLEEDYIDREVEELIQYMHRLFSKHLEEDDISLVVQGSKMTIARQQLPKAFRIAFVKSPSIVTSIIERLLYYINLRHYGESIEYLVNDRFDIHFTEHKFSHDYFSSQKSNNSPGKKGKKKFSSASFYLEDEELYLQLPRQIIDSDYIEEDIFVEIDTGGRMLYEELVLTKSRLLFKTEQALIKLPSFHNKLTYTINSGNHTIFTSQSSLHRDFIVFDEEGNEVIPSKLTDETIRVVTHRDNEVLTDDAETIVNKFHSYRITTVFLNEESILIINNKVLSPNSTSFRTGIDQKYRYQGITIQDRNIEYNMYSQKPSINIRMTYGKSVDDYIISLNNINYNVTEISNVETKTIADGSGDNFAIIDLLEDNILSINPVQILIREKGSNRVFLEDNVFTLDSLFYEFDKSYYYKGDKATISQIFSPELTFSHNDTIKVNLKLDSKYKTQVKYLEKWYWLVIDVPILSWKIDDFSSNQKKSETLWHEDIHDYNLFINYPTEHKSSGLHVVTKDKCEIIEGKETRDGYKYSLDYLFALSNQEPVTLGVILEGNQEKITEIHFKPVVKNLSVAYYDKNIHMTGLFASWNFTGSGNLMVDIIYSATRKIIKSYKLLKGQQIFDKEIELFYGEHDIRIYQIEEDFFGESNIQIVLASQTFIVGDPLIVKSKNRLLQGKKCISEEQSFSIQNFYLKDVNFSKKKGYYEANGYYLKKDWTTGQERPWYFTKNNPFYLKILNQKGNQYTFEILDKDEDGLIYDTETTHINPSNEAGGPLRYKLVDEIIMEIMD